MDKNEKKKNKRIEKFKRLCDTEQRELKIKLKNILSSMGYKNLKNEDGFLYAKGDVPVLLVAHMDTVHEYTPGFFTIANSNGKTMLSSPFGIGGDDRCGIYIILEIIKELKCSVVFCEDEEIGCVGASKFSKTEYVKNLDVNYIIEFDRRGSNDAVFYQCDNEEFEDFVTSEFFDTNFGSCSDISEIAPASGIAAVNLSCGYYKEHTKAEYVVFEEMEDVIENAKKMIQRDVETPFEYIELQDYYCGFYGKRSYTYDYDFWREPVTIKTKSVLKKYLFCYYDEHMEEQFELINGFDENDATLDFLKEHGKIPYDNIISIFGESELEDMGVYI